MMGNDPWGSVVKKTDPAINWDSVISQACGSDAYVLFLNSCLIILLIICPLVHLV